MAFASDLTETALQIAAMRFSFGINQYFGKNLPR